MPRGLNELDEWLQNRDNNKSQQTYHKKLWLKDGERAIIRVLTDIDDMYWDFFHRVPVKTSTGKQFTEERLCLGRGTCNLCDNPEYTSHRMFLAWVYVRKMYYPEPGENREKVLVNRRTLFAENVEEPRLLQMGVTYRVSFVNRADRDGSLLTRDYEWLRQGTKTSLAYLLEPVGDPSDMEPALRQLRTELPDLETLVREQAERASGKPMSITPTKTQKKTTENYDEEVGF